MDIKYQKDSDRVCNNLPILQHMIQSSPDHVCTSSKFLFGCGRDIVGWPWYHKLQLFSSIPQLASPVITPSSYTIMRRLGVFVLDPSLALGDRSNAAASCTVALTTEETGVVSSSRSRRAGGGGGGLVLSSAKTASHKEE
jgi:hypothetical protein